MNKDSVDGNIAFKVTYVDAGWKGVCSDELAYYNFENRTWCGEQSRNVINCRSQQFKNPENLSDEFPCFDCQVLTDFEYFSGIAHGPAKSGEALRSRRASVGKLALFTSRKPGEMEEQRFVFAIAPVVSIESDPTEGFDVFICDPERAIVFQEALRPRFWRSYTNANSDEARWNTGLFRYVSDQVAAQMLQQVLLKGKMSAKSTAKAEALLALVQ